ncbi:MAG TPA: MBL fold metallo-hydrolase [Thermoanaerobaculia bacterium]
MAGKIRVRLYNILLGDAILVTIPSTPKQHILIDVGNKQAGVGANRKLFEPIFKNIIKELGGRPLDLYISTHEHMDHVMGLRHAAEKLKIDVKKALKPRYVWMTGSAHPTYYDTHEEADKQKKLAMKALDQAVAFYANAGAMPPFIQTLLDLNSLSETAACVDFMRNLSDKTYYVSRGMRLTGKHALKDVKISIWAPEEDTSVYYGRFQPLALRDGDGSAAAMAADLVPPPGVDAGAFYNLVQMRNNIGDTLLQIDKAANNTSIVFCLEWNGKKLLFSGDAEERSWKEMNRQGVLEPVDFLKISHHGSHNGTPDVEILDKILPLGVKKKRYAAISTCTGSYPGMPDEDTLGEIAKRATIFSTEKDSEPGKWVDVPV